MSAENKALVRRVYDEVVNQRNVEALDSLCAEDFLDHDPAPGSGGRLADAKTSFRDMLQAFPDLRMTVCRLLARGTHSGGATSTM